MVIGGGSRRSKESLCPNRQKIEGLDAVSGQWWLMWVDYVGKSKKFCLVPLSKFLREGISAQSSSSGTKVEQKGCTL